MDASDRVSSAVDKYSVTSTSVTVTVLEWLSLSFTTRWPPRNLFLRPSVYLSCLIEETRPILGMD